MTNVPRASLIAIAAIVASVFGIAALPSSTRAPGTFQLQTPAVQDELVIRPGGAILLEGAMHRMNGCALRGDGFEVSLEGDSFSETIDGPHRPGAQLMWFEVECDETTVRRFARRVTVTDQGPAERIEIARAHISAPSLEQELSDRLPPMINSSVETLLTELSAGIEAYTEDLSTPDWLVSRATLTENTSIEVEDAAISLTDEGVWLDLTVDITVEVAIHRRPLMRRGRSERHAFDIRIRDRYEPARARIRLGDWPEVEISDITLESTYCTRYDTRWVERTCERIVDWAYRRVERWLENTVSEEANRYIDGLDLSAFFSDSMVEWASHVDLTDRVQDLLQGADLALARTSQDDTGFSFSLAVDAGWLGETPPAQLNVEDSESAIDVAVSASLLNRVLAATFDRPFVEALEELEGLAVAAGGESQLQTAIRRVESFATGTGSDEAREIAGMLDAVELRYTDGWTLRPFVHVASSGRPWLGVHDLRPFESTDPDDHLAVSLSAGAEIDLVEMDSYYRLDPDLAELLTHVAIEPVTTADTPLERRVTRRYEALAELFLQQLLRIAGFGEEEPLIDDGFIGGLLAALPPIPTVFDNGQYIVHISGLRGDAVDQSLRLAAEVVER